MTLRLSLGAVLVAALTAVNCSPPLIRCETDEHCTSDMKCDVRQGVCVDEGDYIENPDGTPVVHGGPGQGGSPVSESRPPAGKDR